MKLTDEQRTIIELVQQNTPLVKILAFAGCGKTSTLVEVAKTNPEKKMLYLAFNKAIQTEASTKFPKNTEVRTTHSLAYRGVVSGSAYQIRNSDYKLVEYKKVLNEWDWNILKGVRTLLKEFFNTDYDTVEEVFQKRKKYILTKMSEKEKNRVLGFGEKFYKLMQSGKLAITHDFYLKEFQLKLKNKDIEIKPYDIILLDEAQDLNKVIFNIFKYLPAKQKIIVGDTHQSIYSFRGAVNALDKFDGATAYLTTSFRLNKEMAEYASYTLRELKGETKPIKSGNTKEDYTIKTTAYISRTNSGIVRTFMQLLETTDEKDIKFIRHPYEIFGLALNLYKFRDGQELDTNFKYILNYGVVGLRELLIDAKRADDRELSTAIALIKELPDRGHFEEIYYKALSCYNLNKERNTKITLTTAHTSKGLEFDKVVLAYEFRLVFSLLELAGGKKKEKDREKDRDRHYKILRDNSSEELIKKIKYKVKNSLMPSFIEELNLLYVTVTRARYELEFFDCPNTKTFIKCTSLREFFDYLKKKKFKEADLHHS